MRVIKTEYPNEVNPIKPIVNQLGYMVRDDDCFAHEWSATDADCRRCAVHLLCAAMYDSVGLQLKRDIAKKQFGKPYLDENTFHLIPREALADLARKYEKQGNPMTFNEVYKLVNDKANMADKETVRLWVHSWILESRLELRDDLIYAKV